MSAAPSAIPPERDCVFFYRWAGVLARSDSPSVYELVETGWIPVACDTRYGSTLCMIEESLDAATERRRAS